MATCDADQSETVSLSVTFLDGAEESYSVGAEESVADLVARIRESRIIDPTHMVQLMREGDILKDAELVMPHTRCSDPVTAVVSVAFTMADGYWQHTDITNPTCTTLEEAFQVGLSTKGCVAVARQRDNGDTYIISQKGAYIRPNGTDGWDWYDRIDA